MVAIIWFIVSIMTYEFVLKCILREKLFDKGSSRNIFRATSPILDESRRWETCEKKTCLVYDSVTAYGVISGPNAGKYGPEITPYLDILHAVYKHRYDLYNSSLQGNF